ncbi:MAG: metalloregulator ArsR/SmtB family transcription factor [Anaerolineae bacterium]|jgi:predicted transcriptional regulator|nr:metalloregulator ArsR/SmtB family transcription factor [Anaerolineae bacterium]
MTNTEPLLSFFKALGHESRLKIVGILANGERTVSEIATILGLKEPTVSQHLTMLREVGLVQMRAEGNYRYYSFNNQALIDISKEVFDRDRIAALAPKFEEVGDPWQQKVLKTFVAEDLTVQLPVGELKYVVILKWLLARFEIDRRYSEAEVNEILLRHHEDYALIRREFVDRGWMQREKGIYWRVLTSP